MTFLENIYPYNFEGITDNVYKYRFISEGNKEITKVIAFRPMEGYNNTYNLGFGNLETQNDEVHVNDKSTDNNSDGNKVLSTVFACMVHFLKQEPSGKVSFFGNTESKHYLYKLKVSSNLVALNEEFDVYGGMVNPKIPIKEYTYTCTKSGRERTRTIKEKDLENSAPINITSIERYTSDNFREYDFVLFRLKQN
jgi:hypothetical protein